jgi:hypothetical protein
MVMIAKRAFAAFVVAALTLGVGVLDASQARPKVKSKSSRAAAAAGAAGAVAGPSRFASRPMAIDDQDANGVFCSLSVPNVHYLGTVPPNFGVVIDFDSDDTSDPIAVLTTVKIEGTSVAAENQASDDEGGNLNPRFEMRKNYLASYILTVGTADDDEACYFYRVRLVQ